MEEYGDGEDLDDTCIWRGHHHLLEPELHESKAAYRKRCEEQTALDWEDLYVKEYGRPALHSFYVRCWDARKKLEIRRWEVIGAAIMAQND